MFNGKCSLPWLLLQKLSSKSLFKASSGTIHLTGIRLSAGFKANHLDSFKEGWLTISMAHFKAGQVGDMYI